MDAPGKRGAINLMTALLEEGAGDRDAVAVQDGGRLTGIVTIRNLLLGLSDKPRRLERVA